MEDNAPDEAIRLYTDACEILEEDGKEQMAFDLYRAATSVYIKLEKYGHLFTLNRSINCFFYMLEMNFYNDDKVLWF